MHLEVLIPTFNRAPLLAKALESLNSARIPTDLSVAVTVLDNNSTDDTPRLVANRRLKCGDLKYIAVPQQGKSYALNTGILQSRADLIGMIDDDEEVDGGWYDTIASAFSDQDIDFIGGPVIPRLGANRPDWLPDDYKAVIGWVDGGQDLADFNNQFPGMLTGGNAVIRRSVFDLVGLYNPSLGRKGTRLLTCEDEELYERLLASSRRGLYVPSLVIYHHVPAERLTKRYHRRWCFWRGTSKGLMHRKTYSTGPHWLGVPRYLYGSALRAAFHLAIPRPLSGCSASRRFSDELKAWDLAGFLYGRHFYNGD